MSIQKWILLVYKRIFHEEISEEIKKFIKNLKNILVSTTISAIFSFTFNIVSGRVLGSSEYGKFALIQSIAMFLQIPMLLGVPTAMVKYTSEKNDIIRQKKIISISYVLVLIFTFIFIGIYEILSSEISEKLSIPINDFYISIIFTIITIFYTLNTYTLLSLNQIKKYAIIKSLYGVLQLISFTFFVFISYISYKSVVYSLFIASILLGMLSLRYIIKYIQFEFDSVWAKVIINYSVFTVVNDISYFIYTNIDKILINKYMSLENVGIYNAYFYSSINVLNIFAGTITTVLLPTISKYENKDPIFNKVNRLIPYLIVIGLPFTLISEYLILNIYGEDYPFNLYTGSLFAIAAILTVWYNLYVTVLNSEGSSGVKINLLSAMAIAGINILFDIYLIPFIGLNGAMTATILGYLTGICIIYYKSILIKKDSSKKLIP